MSDYTDRLIKAAAGLLRHTPSTDSNDYPRIPQYYLREVFDYTDRAREAAIFIRDAADRITKLESQLDGLVEQGSEMELRAMKAEAQIKAFKNGLDTDWMKTDDVFSALKDSGVGNE